MKDPKTKDSVYFIVISSEQFSFDIKVYIKNEDACMVLCMQGELRKKGCMSRISIFIRDCLLEL